ncbi:14972_t:CDS:2, partial [Acaulospora morrowiae]
MSFKPASDPRSTEPSPVMEGPHETSHLQILRDSTNGDCDPPKRVLN